ncbi:putative NAD(P)H dehydrogenase (quinone) FQR1-like 2 [Dichanthelium oligosanthes]|uniref:NAD(P)H dehydrogenase (quinone) n=1 Tax=Dichanthelium oligosanthes TaxID=888268 RepID=A0A1E5VJA4_9POAL|nr:putative NAD(P)H dehydrogenase (quinone) FQR1-like 2 [Dichanthelium oligosanthes]
MGKGGGCVPSKKRQPPAAAPSSSSAAAAAAPREAPEEEATAAAAAAAPVGAVRKLRLYIVFYSMYGHVESLARRTAVGAGVVEGVEAVLRRVPETLPPEVLEKMQAPAKDPAVPVIASAAELLEADGVLFGFPTRYGAMAAQMKAFFDSTGSLWEEQKLAGKPAGFFVSTGTQGGGQETTAWTAITQLVHHGMLFVPIGYTFGAGMFNMDDIRGGSPYGAGVFAGDGSRRPSETELALAEHQGKYMGSIVKKLGHHV